MDTINKKSSQRINVFSEIQNISLIDYLCLEYIFKNVRNNRKILMIKDISYQVFARYWELNTTQVALTNEVKSIVIRKYGLSAEASAMDIVQVLNYANDRKIDFQLFCVIKATLNNLKSPLSTIKMTSESGRYWSNYLYQEWRCGDTFLKFDNKQVEINAAWAKYIYSNFEFLNQSIKENIDYNADKTEKLTSPDRDAYVEKNISFDQIVKLENRMKFHQVLDRIRYCCLEEAFDWIHMTYDKYNEIRQLYVQYIHRYNVKETTTNFPLVTTLLLLYTAVYRYNDNENGSNGFWPEFFGGAHYNFSSDVQPVMNAMNQVSRRYDIDTQERYYMSKQNLRKIFSQIYIPEFSLRKIFNAIYSYYYKNSYMNHIVNLFDFIEVNSYKLDKAGLFLLESDKLIHNAFDKIISMFDEGLDDDHFDQINGLPEHFADIFKSWRNHEKIELDQKKEEYYIESPKIIFDALNEKILLNLPFQKSRVYPDEETGWRIVSDEKSDFIDGRIIKQNNGIYSILSEEIELEHFNNIHVEYIFNKTMLKYWEFYNKDNHFIFNYSGQLVKNEKVKRGICYIAVQNSNQLKDVNILETYQINKWSNYNFYQLSLENFKGNKYKLDSDIIIEIDEQPLIRRQNFNLVFENSSFSHDIQGFQVFDKLGEFVFDTFNIDKKDFKVDFYSFNVDSKTDCLQQTTLQKEDDNCVHLRFRSSLLEKGFYKLTVKYKNKNILREEFAFIDRLDFVDEFSLNYEDLNNNEHCLIIEKKENYNIIPTHIHTLVTEDAKHYYLKPLEVAKVQFGLNMLGKTVPIEKVVKPISWRIIGLESVMNINNDNWVQEITNTVFDENDIRLQIENYDYRYKNLVYTVCFHDLISGETLIESRKLQYGSQFILLFQNIKDRVLNFSSMVISLIVEDENQTKLYEQVILRVFEKIELLSCKKIINHKQLMFSWEEKHNNKERSLKLYNFTAVWEEPIEFELTENETQIDLNLEQLNLGVYVPLLDYKKKDLFFGNINSKKRFFKKKELTPFIQNKYGQYDENLTIWIYKVLCLYASEKYETVDELLRKLNFNLYNPQKLFYLLIQMKYLLRENNALGNKYYLNHSYLIIKYGLKKFSQEELLTMLLKEKEYFKLEDLYLILNMILSGEQDITVSDNLIDLLSKVDTINALCCVKNNSGHLTDNLIASCKESFDNELLRLVRNHDAILRLVTDEVDIITAFWDWVISYEHKYILKYDYSLDKAFRTYELENNISTLRVAGNTVDDVVESIKCDKVNVSIPINYFRYLSDAKEKYKIFFKLINKNIDDSYKQVLYGAFLSTGKFGAFSNQEYFNMIMSFYDSEQWNLFQRYRAIFKLIFI